MSPRHRPTLGLRHGLGLGLGAWLLAACEPASLAIDPADTLPDGDSAETDTFDDTPDDTAASAAPIVDAAVDRLSDVVTILEVTWTQNLDASAVWVDYTFQDTLHSTPPVAMPAGDVRIPLLGIPPETDVMVQIHVQVGAAVYSLDAPLAGRTGVLPADLRLPDVHLWEPALAHPDRYLLISVDVGNDWFGGPFYTLILDREGQVVWYRKTPNSRCTMFPRIARDGNHLLYDATTLYVFNDSAEPELFRTTLDLREQSSLVIPDWHYTYEELADGDVLVDTSSDGGAYRFSLTRVAPDGAQEPLWDCYPWMAAYAPSQYWACAANAIVWSPSRGTALWSMFETSTVVEVDLETGDLRSQWGQLPDGWSFDPPDTNFDLQHYPNWTSAGTLMVSTHVIGVPFAQRAREFRLHEDERRLEQIWSYGEDTERYARYAGETSRLDNDNRIVNFGTDGVLQEVTPDGEIVWELEWRDRLIGHATLLDDLYALNEGGFSSDQ